MTRNDLPIFWLILTRQYFTKNTYMSDSPIIGREFLCPAKMVITVLFILMVSCKKSGRPTPLYPPDNKRLSQILDSIYLYAEQIYLWNTQLPDSKTFNSGKYVAMPLKEMELVQTTLFDISQYAVNPVTQKPFEQNPFQPTRPKYSSVIDYITPANNIIDKTLSGSGEGWGLGMLAADKDDIRVQYVVRGTPADNAGIIRGCRILKINGHPASTTESYYEFVNAAFLNNTVTLTLLDEEKNKEHTVSLSRAENVANPVYKDSIYQLNQHKVGYFSYHYFSPESNSRRFLTPIFDKFAREHISDLVIDIRYNSGGYINTCKYIANMIVPPTANGKVMFTEHYNKMMQDGKAVILAKQPIFDADGDPVMLNDREATMADIDFSTTANTTLFKKENGLQLKNVYFIVSNKTASAAELLINSLKPYMGIKLIGVSFHPNEPVKTYGKPVGFFDIKIDKYKVYLSLFQDKNANNEGDYFDGMPADVSLADEVRYNFGNLKDPALNAAIQFIEPGFTNRVGVQTETLRHPAIDANFQIKELGRSPVPFNGMIKEDIIFKK